MQSFVLELSVIVFAGSLFVGLAIMLVEALLPLSSRITLTRTIENLRFLASRKQSKKPAACTEFASVNLVTQTTLSMTVSLVIQSYFNNDYPLLVRLCIAVFISLATTGAIYLVFLPIARTICTFMKEAESVLNVATAVIKKAREDVVISEDEEDAHRLKKQEEAWEKSEVEWEAIMHAIDSAKEDPTHIQICPSICNIMKPPSRETFDRLSWMNYDILYGHCQADGAACLKLTSEKISSYPGSCCPRYEAKVSKDLYKLWQSLDDKNSK